MTGIKGYTCLVLYWVILIQGTHFQSFVLIEKTQQFQDVEDTEFLVRVFGVKRSLFLAGQRHIKVCPSNQQAKLLATHIPAYEAVDRLG